MDKRQDSIRGRIEIQIMNEGTKSEGNYTYLIDNGNRSYRLFRKDEAEFNDPFFDQFAELIVVAKGKLCRDWFCVEAIEIDETEEVVKECDNVENNDIIEIEKTE